MHISMQNLFNELSDGVIVFSRDGSLEFMNEPVRRWLSLPRQPKNTLEHLWTKVREALDSGASLPLSIVLELSRGADGRWPMHFDDIATLTASPRPTEVVLLLRPANTTETIARTTRGLKGLLDDELNVCLSGLLEAIDGAARCDEKNTPDAASPSQLRHEISARIAAARNLLTDFNEALKLSLDAPLIDSQRVLFDALVEKVVGDLCSRTSRGDLQISVHYREEALAPVYGSALWLEKALVALLEHMLAVNRSTSNLTVTVRQLNNYLQLAIKQKNAVSIKPAAKSHVSAGAPASDPASAPSGSQLSLTFARKVIEAHGGALKVFQDIDGFADIQMQLPTGRAPSDDAALQQQLECYAQDLNQVLKKSARKNSRNYATH
jgi:signal transduction histidine kinase